MARILKKQNIPFLANSGKRLGLIDNLQCVLQRPDDLPKLQRIVCTLGIIISVSVVGTMYKVCLKSG